MLKRNHKKNESQQTQESAVRSTRNFSSIMAETTHDMTKQKRLFSNFIHLKPISSVSDLVGKTIARPNAILFGSILSFTVTLSLYLLAKNYGYSLSGFESIGSFIIGWIIGILFDLLVPIFKKK